MLRVWGVFIVAVWLLALATAHTFGGWIHLLPLAVLLGVAARVVYMMLTAD